MTIWKPLTCEGIVQYDENIQWVKTYKICKLHEKFSGQKLLEEIAFVLKPGGVAIVTTPVRLTETPIDHNHIKEFFPKEFKNIMSDTFSDVVVHLSIPADSLLLYYWRPRIFFRVQICKYFFNLMNILFGWNIVEGIQTLDRYHTLQVATGEKSKQ